MSCQLERKQAMADVFQHVDGDEGSRRRKSDISPIVTIRHRTLSADVNRSEVWGRNRPTAWIPITIMSLELSMPPAILLTRAVIATLQQYCSLRLIDMVLR